MEEEIEEKLEELYKARVDVKFRKYGIYDVFLTLNYDNMISIVFLYDRKTTLETNIKNVISKIDNEIIKLYKKKGENKKWVI